jgi:hypothetical protein
MSPWYGLLIFWGIFLLQYAPDLGKDIKKEAAVMFIGANFFFFVEYLLHRFLFHGEHTWM